MGWIERTKIIFRANGVDTGKFYYQTHLIMQSADQIQRLEDTSQHGPTSAINSVSGTVRSDPALEKFENHSVGTERRDRNVRFGVAESVPVGLSFPVA